MTPPLRDKSNQAELWKGLKMDDLQVISTDHCPFCMKEQKELGRDDFTKIPNGAPGVENRVPLIYNGGVVKIGSVSTVLSSSLRLQRRKCLVCSQKKARSRLVPTPTS